MKRKISSGNWKGHAPIDRGQQKAWYCWQKVLHCAYQSARKHKSKQCINVCTLCRVSHTYSHTNPHSNKAHTQSRSFIWHATLHRINSSAGLRYCSSIDRSFDDREQSYHTRTLLYHKHTLFFCQTNAQSSVVSCDDLIRGRRSCRYEQRRDVV